MATDVQGTIWAFLATQRDSISVHDVAAATGLTQGQCAGGLTMLKKKGVVLTEGGGHATRWRVVEGAVPTLRGSGINKTAATNEPHALAFKQAMDTLLDAFIAIQPYIISADDKEALTKLKAATAAWRKTSE